eukprot:6862528-Ditylum_brightwellii.AAC.1
MDTNSPFEAGIILTTPADKNSPIVIQDYKSGDTHTISPKLITTVKPSPLDTTEIQKRCLLAAPDYPWVQ